MEVQQQADALAPNRRKPNRWGPKIVRTPVQAPPIEAVAETAVPAGQEVKKPRKSRFTSDEAATPSDSVVMVPTGRPLQAVAPKLHIVTQEIIQQTVVLQMKLKLVNEKILCVSQDAVIRDQNPDRSPSPPPRYDAFGKRSNTTEVWMRENLMNERAAFIEEMIKLNPLYVPPSDYVKPKPFRMLRIPQREFPNYNFIGLIIGPRGNTQKRLEMETGTKISIRGKGSVKEGSKGRANKAIDEQDELHVHITGDEEAKVVLAAKMVAELLCPVDDDKNEHKQRQLKELALINGTLKEDEFCPECGERGHRQYECPQRIKSFKNAGVKCSICGDLSHPTRDCPQRDKGLVNSVALDSEYDSFMSELGGRVKESTVVTSTTSLIAPKKAQTIVHVTEVMTGLTPPSFIAPPIAPPPPMFGAPAPWSAIVPPIAPYNPYAGYVPAQPPLPMEVPLPPLPVPPPPPDAYSALNEMD